MNYPHSITPNMKLSKTTAQQIVRRTMQIIPHSVNVMDENGIIIASGDPKRLNQHHTGAVLVLRRNQAVEIDENLAKQWQLKAGINLPITYLGQNIGVIGISGEPNLVRPYGELVKMAAELIVESNAQLERAHWQHRYKEEFLRQLLNGRLDEQSLKQQAEFFRIDLNQAVAVILIKLHTPTEQNLQKLQHYLAQHFPQFATVVTNLTSIALFYTASPERLTKTLLQRFLPPQDTFHGYTLAVGMPVADFSLLHRSYQTALDTLHYAETHHIQKHYLNFQDYCLPVLLTEFSQSWQGAELSSLVHQLAAHDPHNHLRKTLRHYFLSNCDLDHTACRLSIHPNTLRYRLHKIEQITGLSFNHIEQKFMLYLGSMLETSLYKNTKK